MGEMFMLLGILGSLLNPIKVQVAANFSMISMQLVHVYVEKIRLIRSAF